MGNPLKKIWKKRWMLRSILHTIYFNLHYLPFKQAVKLPIMLCRPRFMSLKGSVRINGPIKTGMIQLGTHGVSIYPNSGIMIENHGGEIVFHGPCVIGSSSAITVGEGARLEIGAEIMANAAIKVICFHEILIGNRCRLAWETMLMDTDFHTLTKPDGTRTKGYGTIRLGENCWLGTGCLVQKNTVLPPFTTVQARTVLCKAYDIPPKSVIGMDTKVVVKASQTYRDLGNDRIQYPFSS